MGVSAAIRRNVFAQEAYMRSARTSAAFLLLVVLTFLSWSVTATPVAGQAIFAAITGTVTDSSGAVLPGATVNVTNVDTNVTKTLTTNAAGVYNATNLIPGTYKVEASLSGFKTALISPVTLEVNANQK